MKFCRPWNGNWLGSHEVYNVLFMDETRHTETIGSKCERLSYIFHEFHHSPEIIFSYSLRSFHPTQHGGSFYGCCIHHPYNCTVIYCQLCWWVPVTGCHRRAKVSHHEGGCTKSHRLLDHDLCWKQLATCELIRSGLSIQGFMGGPSKNHGRLQAHDKDV